MNLQALRIWCMHLDSIVVSSSKILGMSYNKREFENKKKKTKKENQNTNKENTKRKKHKIVLKINQLQQQW